MNPKLYLFYFFLILPLLTSASNALEVRFHDEAADTSRLNALLIEGERAVGSSAPQGERVAFFARKFIDTPYVGYTLEAPDSLGEALTVNLGQLDCTTFVETVVALASTLGENRTSWRDYVYNLRRLRYRGGSVDGYASRLHYIADWAVDNIHKGMLADATLLMPRCSFIVRSIDYMSNHRDAYPSLADSAQYARIRRVEQGYRNHRFPYLRTSDLYDKKIRDSFEDGDILAFVSTLKDLDVTHMGIVLKAPDGTLRVVHASSTDGKVKISSKPIQDFLKSNRRWQGVRVFRALRP